MPDLLRSYDVAFYHSEFYGRMVRDVGREIDWQRTHSNELAGNMLCALALVVYTEVLGGLAEGQLERRRTTNAEAFHSFLRRMAGGRYDDFRKGWETARGLRL